MMKFWDYSRREGYRLRNRYPRLNINLVDQSLKNHLREPHCDKYPSLVSEVLFISVQTSQIHQHHPRVFVSCGDGQYSLCQMNEVLLELRGDDCPIVSINSESRCVNNSCAFELLGELLVGITVLRYGLHFPRWSPNLDSVVSSTVLSSAL